MMGPDVSMITEAVEDRSQEVTRKCMACFRLHDVSGGVDWNLLHYPPLPSSLPLNRAALQPKLSLDDHVRADDLLSTSLCVASLLEHQTVVVPG